MSKANEHKKIIVNNRKARHDYFLDDFLEVGLVLKGTEIKSLRRGEASLDDSYIVFKNGEAFILNMYIAPYDKGNIFNHEPRRTRKLLMHKHEIRKFAQKVKEKGFAIIPVELYLTCGRAKLTIALGKGKKLYDKRESLKAKDDARNIEKALKSKMKEVK